MKSRVVAVAVGALSLLGITACSSDAGTGAPPATTVKLGEASFVTLPPVLTSTTIASTVPGGGAAVVAGEQEYTVVGGDYLLKIAKLFCIKYTDIVSFNSWENENHPLNAGDIVKIPPNACAPGSNPEPTTAPTTATATEATSAATTTTVDTSGGGTYTVKEGDTLYGIAAKTGTTADAIVAANGWEGVNHVIYAGLKIKMPAPTG